MVWTVKQKNYVAILGRFQNKQAIYHRTRSEVIYRCILCHADRLWWDSNKTISQFYIFDKVVHTFYFQRKTFHSLFAAYIYWIFFCISMYWSTFLV